MITIYVPDVGDGLAAGIRTLDGTDIEIDCGSQHDAKLAFHKGLYLIRPKVFFLSHFHADHYNGLLYAHHMRPGPWLTIRQVFYPCIPVFPQREMFLRCMLAMNHWLMGDASGSMAADFLSVLSSINHRSFTYRSLCMGDTVSIGGSQYDVLWPPATVDDDATLKVIATAISYFKAAAKEDETLRRILDTIGESGEMRPYLAEERETAEMLGRGENAERRKNLPLPLSRKDLPEPIRRANESLRKAANHLSLAFHEDNKLLFLGDLESHEIKRVVQMLAGKERNQFFVTITPHHGTHWQKNLLQLHTCCAISSIGAGLFRHISSEYKSISDIHFITHLNGDVEFPAILATWYRPRSWRCWSTFL